MIINTASGSSYEINTNTKTWARIVKTNTSGIIRTEEGSYDLISKPEIGIGLKIYCPPINDKSDLRVIWTSNVISIEMTLQDFRTDQRIAGSQPGYWTEG